MRTQRPKLLGQRRRSTRRASTAGGATSARAIFPCATWRHACSADLTDPSSQGFFLADFKGRHHGDLIYVISWNRDTPMLPNYANDEEVSLIHYVRDDYFEWWGGFHKSEEYAHTGMAGTPHVARSLPRRNTSTPRWARTTAFPPRPRWSSRCREARRASWRSAWKAC